MENEPDGLSGIIMQIGSDVTYFKVGECVIFGRAAGNMMRFKNNHFIIIAADHIWFKLIKR